MVRPRLATMRSLPDQSWPPSLRKISQGIDRSRSIYSTKIMAEASVRLRVSSFLQPLVFLQELVIGRPFGAGLGGRHGLQPGLSELGREIGIAIGVLQLLRQCRHGVEVGDAGALLGGEDLL